MHRKVQFCHQEILLFLQCLAPVVKTMEDVNSFVSPFQTEQNLNVSVPQVFWIRMENPAMVFFFYFISFYYAFANLLCFDFFEQ